MVNTISFKRGNLLHWLVADRSYFVTIRLAGSLPKKILDQLKEERARFMSKRLESEDAVSRFQRKQIAKTERVLDSSSGDRMWLRRHGIARIVFDALEWFEKKCGWRIHPATIMGNHVHILMRNTVGGSGSLLRDLGQYKGFTARQANAVLRRKGAFWAREDFDHWCRTEKKVRAAARYICNNPVKAGFVSTWSDWRWTICREEYRPVEE